MEDEKDIEQKIAGAFGKDSGCLPEEKYFDKIWNSIEFKAPVGEKYYLRSFFSIFFIFLLVVIFIFFYSSFLSSVLTLKEIRAENQEFLDSSSSSNTPEIDKLKPAAAIDLCQNIHIAAQKDSRFSLQKKDSREVVLDFYSGHVIVDKKAGPRVLIVQLPDISVSVPTGRCNIFCYDGITRIIPLTDPVSLLVNGQTKNQIKTIGPGDTFYLLDGEEKIVADKVKKSGMEEKKK